MTRLTICYKRSLHFTRHRIGDTTPGGTTPGDTTPGGTTPGDTTPGDTTPGDTTPGDTTPGGTGSATGHHNRRHRIGDRPS